jgi:hypothetical protein
VGEAGPSAAHGEASKQEDPAQDRGLGYEADPVLQRSDRLVRGVRGVAQELSQEQAALMERFIAAKQRELAAYCATAAVYEQLAELEEQLGQPDRVVNRDEPEASRSDWHGDGTAGDQATASALAAMLAAGAGGGGVAWQAVCARELDGLALVEQAEQAQPGLLPRGR